MFCFKEASYSRAKNPLRRRLKPRAALTITDSANHHATGTRPEPTRLAVMSFRTQLIVFSLTCQALHAFFRMKKCGLSSHRSFSPHLSGVKPIKFLPKTLLNG